MNRPTPPQPIPAIQTLNAPLLPAAMQKAVLPLAKNPTAHQLAAPWNAHQTPLTANRHPASA